MAMVLLAAACVADEPPPEDRPTPTPGEPVVSETPPSELPAVEPQQPSLADFSQRAVFACTQAMATIGAAPLRGDPLRPGASPRAMDAAVEHYRARSVAWTGAAEDLWQFGVPMEKVGQRFITALDTVAQYSQQTADLLRKRDWPTAQAGVAAVETSMARANRIAESLGLGNLEECGTPPVTLSGAQRVRVAAVDHSFSVDPLRRGATRFVVRNSGVEDHQLFVVRLREPGVLDDAIRADRDGRLPREFLADDGVASPVVRPGEHATVDVRLRPGAYGLVCFVASEDGTPHAYKGMATEVSVP